MPRFASKISAFLLSLLAASACLPGSLHARLYGEAELGYVDYKADTGGTHQEGSSLRQKYSLLYANKGLLDYGKLGGFRYALGYEWATFRTKIKAAGDEETLSDSAGHFLYEGRLMFQPKQLPLSLLVFSEDLSRSYFNDYGSGLNEQLISPRLTSSIENGTHIRTGGTLVVGIKDEVLHPLYKEVPRLIVDYLEQSDKNDHSVTPTETRDRQIKVMLSKGDVELGFFRQDYSDKITNSASFTDDRVTIGTVSYREGRKWVDLSNWIKISTDLTFERLKEGGNSTTDDYSFNLHTVADRERWGLSNFNSFGRTVSPEGIATTTRIPVYVKGVWSTDTDWQVRLLADEYETTGNGTTFSATTREDLLASIKVNTLKRSNFTLSPSFSVEKVQDGDIKTQTVQADVETSSTPRLSSRYALYGRYSVVYTATDRGDDGRADYVLNTLQGRGIYRVSDQLRLEADQTVKVGSGKNQTVENAGILSGGVVDRTNVPGSTGERVVTPNSMVQSISKFTVSYVPTPRLRTGLILSADVLKQEDADADIIARAVGTVEYALPTFTVGSSLAFRKRSFGEVDVTEYSSNGSATYKPDQKMSSEIQYSFTQTYENDTTTTDINLLQRFRYALQKTTGFGAGRNWINLTEELYYNKAKSQKPGELIRNDSERRLTLGADYFPMRYVFLSATIRYSLIDPRERTELVGGAAVGALFPTLQATLDYSYGKRKGDEKYDDRVEQRISANVKKQF